MVYTVQWFYIVGHSIVWSDVVLCGVVWCGTMVWRSVSNMFLFGMVWWRGIVSYGKVPQMEWMMVPLALVNGIWCGRNQRVILGSSAWKLSLSPPYCTAVPSVGSTLITLRIILHHFCIYIFTVNRYYFFMYFHFQCLIYLFMFWNCLYEVYFFVWDAAIA